MTRSTNESWMLTPKMKNHMVMLRRVAVVTAGLVGLATAASAVSWFVEAEHFPTGSSIGPGPGATTTIAIDVDRDGDVDVVTTDWFGDGPLVLKNFGDGRFGDPLPISGASDVGALATGDLNGDGRPDLVGRESSGVVALIAKGDGTFVPQPVIAVSANAQQSVAVFDTNGDRALDIVTPERLGIRVLFGRGDGSFDVGPVSPLIGLLADAKPANLDGDGRADLVVADASPATPQVVALRGGGDGTFAESGRGVVGYGPEAVMAGDLNGDGRDDAVSVDSFSVVNAPPSFSITVLIGDGAGGFGPPTTYPTGDGPVSGAIGDINGDGALDVAVSAVGGSVVAVYAGDSNGTLGEVGRFSVVRQPQTPVVADFNRDGAPDIAVPGVGQLSLLRNVHRREAAPSPASPAVSPPSSFSERLPATGGLIPLWPVAAMLGISVVMRRWIVRGAGRFSDH